MYLATLTVAKVMLYRGMRDAHVAKSELAPSQLALSAVDRVLDLNHGSRDQIDAARAAVGLRLDVVGVVAIRSGSPAAATSDGA